MSRNYCDFKLLIPYFIYLLMFSFTASASWQPAEGGECNCVAIAFSESSTSGIAGVASGGVWQLDQNGAWLPINDFIIDAPYFGIWDVNFIDSQADTIILRIWEYSPGPGATTYISTDGGNDWTLVDGEFTSAGWNMVEKVIVDPSNHNRLYYINSYYFAISEDFGNEWTYSVMDGFYTQKSGLYKYEDDLFVTSLYAYNGGDEHGGFQCSSDNGDTWQTMVPFYSNWGVEMASVQDFIQLSNGDYLLAVNYSNTGNWSTQSLVVSTDTGMTWERTGNGLPPNYRPHNIIEDTFIPGRLFIHGELEFGIYISDDFGRNWSRCLNGLPENASIVGDLYQDPNDGIIYTAVESCGIYSSANSGMNWEYIEPPPLGSHGNLSIFPSTIGLRDSGYRLWSFDPLSLQPDEINLPVAEDTISIPLPVCYANQDTVITAFRRFDFLTADRYLQMAHSFDGGANWSLGPFLSISPYRHFSVYCNEDTVRFVNIDSLSDSIYYSSDYGFNWDVFSSPGIIYSIIQDEENIYVSSDFDVFRFDWELNDWVSLNYYGPSIEYFLVIYNDDLYIKTVPQPYSFIHRYSDGTWTEQGESDLFLSNVQALEVGGDTVFIGSTNWSNSLMFSYDFCATWDSVEYSLPYPGQTFKFYDLEYDRYREILWASTGAGLCYVEKAELSASPRRLNFKPINSINLSASPNPFNSVVNIRYYLPNSTEVKLRIYDITGREVWTVIHGPQSAGFHEVIWKAELLSSGIYFAKLDIDSGSITKKMLLIK